MTSKLKGRYSTYGTVEGEFEPRSNNRVLKNLLGVKSKHEMDVVESAAYDEITSHALDSFAKDHQFTAQDICKLHQRWFGKVYSWAGEYRSVNMSKGDFQFASAHLIPKLMHEFEKDVLRKYT